MSSFQQLSPQFTPRHYDVVLDINEQQNSFEGSVTITGTPAQNGSLILHAKQLNIASVAVNGRAADITIGDFDELRISAENIVAAEEHVLTLTFSGTASDAMHGMYPCYFTSEGTEKKLFATQFESHHAREVFPCIDEPAAKATFALTLTHDSKSTALSNMPPAKATSRAGRSTTSFEPTPRMSSYLLAWVVGEMQSVSATTARGITVGVWASSAQQADELSYPLEVAVRVIDFYEDYFGVEYPLPKSDHVALPDFSSGAMENWGLITYRETALLASTKSSLESRRRVATVIAHELAHQWFGNLVTMQWWDELWLNESFANMMEYVAVDALYPEWEMWLEFSSSESVYSARRDVIDGVQAVQVAVHHPDEIGSLFDPAIVYAKGAKLIKMLRAYVGDDAFRVGLQSYFKEHAYGNTRGDDLWRALEEASGKPVGSIMRAWITQPGIPVVSIEKLDTGLHMQQERLFVGPHEPSTQIWPILLGASDKTLPEIMQQAKLSIDTDISNIQLNHGDNAHVIISYSHELQQHLLASVEAGKLDVLSRLQLLNDYSLLARAGKASSAALLDMLPYYRHESNHFVWGALSMIFGELKKFCENDIELERKLRKLAGQVARERYEELGWHKSDNEAADVTELRSNILGLMCFSEAKDVIATALSIADDLHNIDADIRPIVFGVVAKFGTDKSREALLALHDQTASAELRDDLTIGITSAVQPQFIDTLLTRLLDSRLVRPQDVSRWFAYLMRNHSAKTHAWHWMKKEWAWIEDQFGGDKSYDDFARYSASAITTQDLLHEYKTFFGPMSDNPSMGRAISMGISEIEGRVELIERDLPAVRESLFKL